VKEAEVKYGELAAPAALGRLPRAAGSSNSGRAGRQRLHDAPSPLRTGLVALAPFALGMRSPAVPGAFPGIDAERLSDAEIERSIDETLAARNAAEPFWVFAYGSLMWNPGFAFVAKRVGTVYGFHRNFGQWSHQPRHPGPAVLTLERGGCCRGLAYRLGQATTRETSRLWRRR
jgi:hypothetical protein